MRAAGTAARRWAALRSIYEGAEPVAAVLAEAANLDAATLEKRIAREGWVRVAHAADRDRARRIGRMLDRAIGEVEAIGDGREEGSGFDKSRIDALAAHIRTLEKIGEITRGEESAKENQMRRDDEMAGILKIIDERIVELARAYAGELGAGDPAPGAR